METRRIETAGVLDIVAYVHRKKKVHQVIVLNKLEEVLGKDTPEFKAVRKIVLDSSNDFTRSIVRAIFGDDFESG